MIDYVRTYYLYQKMNKFPHLINEMRKIFLDAIIERGIVTHESLQAEALKGLGSNQKEINEKNIQEYINVLIDFYFSYHFSDKEIENSKLARAGESRRAIESYFNFYSDSGDNQ